MTVCIFAKRGSSRLQACGYDLRADFTQGCPECGWRREAKEAEYAMNRRLLIIAVCLLLGVVVNVAVAWGCALWATPSSRENGGFQVAGVPWTYLRMRGFGVDRIRLRNYAQSWPVGKLPDGVPEPRFGPEIAVEQAYVSAGWPWQALRTQAVVEQPVTERRRLFFEPGYPEVSWDFGFVLPGDPGPPVAAKVLPLRPMLLGFVADTLLYAALLWLLIPGPFVLRRFLRVRRGLCPKCAYPIGESSVCTECACELPKRARTT